jgi:hypothetical protein
LNEASTGLTVHCNSEAAKVANRRLGGHCVLRKYAHKAKTWFGMCIGPRDSSLRFGFKLDYPWSLDPSLETATQHLRPLTRWPEVIRPVPTKRIGRNDPCPCGSGLKYKKCCGK